MPLPVSYSYAAYSAFQVSRKKDIKTNCFFVLLFAFLVNLVILDFSPARFPLILAVVIASCINKAIARGKIEEQGKDFACAR